MTSQQKAVSNEFWEQANAYIYDDMMAFNHKTYLKLYKQMLEWNLLSEDELWLLKDEGLPTE